MADSNRPTASSKSPSWIDGLPHNFDGWGPKTPDAEIDDAIHAHSELTFAGETDDRRHYVWTFQRARHRHH